MLINYHNNNKMTKYIPIRKTNMYTKYERFYKIWRYIKEHTLHLTIPCVFQFENSERFKQILTKVKNEIKNKKLHIILSNKL